jgi:hypothetical protein
MQVKPLYSEMAQTTSKSRQGTKMNISTEVQKINAYEPQLMTLKEN